MTKNYFYVEQSKLTLKFVVQGRNGELRASLTNEDAAKKEAKRLNDAYEIGFNEAHRQQ